MMMGNGRYRLQINEVVHLLASRLNQEVDKYVAWQPDPGAFAIDAFTVDWSDYPLPYCFPPEHRTGSSRSSVGGPRLDDTILAPHKPTEPHSLWRRLVLTGWRMSGLPGEPGQFHLWPGRGQGSYIISYYISHVTFMPVLLRPVNNFLGQVIENASEGKYNTVNNSSPGEVTFLKCLNSGITLFSSKNNN